MERALEAYRAAKKNDPDLTLNDYYPGKPTGRDCPCRKENHGELTLERAMQRVGSNHSSQRVQELMSEWGICEECVEEYAEDLAEVSWQVFISGGGNINKYRAAIYRTLPSTNPYLPCAFECGSQKAKEWAHWLAPSVASEGPYWAQHMPRQAIQDGVVEGFEECAQKEEEARGRGLECWDELGVHAVTGEEMVFTTRHLQGSFGG